MNIKKILLSSILILITVLLFYSIFYRSFWFVSITSITPIFLQYLIFVFVFAIFYKGIPGEGIKKGIIYSLSIWMLKDLVTFLFSLFTSISIGDNREAYNALQYSSISLVLIYSLILSIFNGLIIGFIYKKEI